MSEEQVLREVLHDLIEEGEAKGRAEGKAEGRAEVVAKMLRELIPVSVIMKCSDFSAEKIAEIAQSIGVTPVAE